MSREHFTAAHEELIAEYLETHPEATDAEAYEATADGAYDRMTDNLADMADYYDQLAAEYDAKVARENREHHASLDWQEGGPL